jgi:hypothetical protein
MECLYHPSKDTNNSEYVYAETTFGDVGVIGSGHILMTVANLPFWDPNKKYELIVMSDVRKEPAGTLIYHGAIKLLDSIVLHYFAGGRDVNCRITIKELGADSNKESKDASLSVNTFVPNDNKMECDCRPSNSANESESISAETTFSDADVVLGKIVMTVANLPFREPNKKYEIILNSNVRKEPASVFMYEGTINIYTFMSRAKDIGMKILLWVVGIVIMIIMIVILFGIMMIGAWARSESSRSES